MKTVNPTNERIKRAYYAYLKEAKRNSEQTVDAAAKALSRFETYTKFKDFRVFRIEQAVGFKAHLAQQLNGRTKKPLSKATMLQTLAALRAFFFWLAGQPGFRSKVSYSDADYFNLSAKETAIARADRDVGGPTLEQVRHVLAVMPNGTDIEKRNRALIAFTILTGARDNAVASFRLKHIDLIDGKVVQDARDVRTKASKTFTTYFFPVGDDIRQIVEDWVQFLRRDRFWGPDDPLFPATKVVVGKKQQFEAVGLDRKGWSNAAPIRAIFKDAFRAAGFPYFNPHSFRNTLARLGQSICRSPEEMKAWSQNMGHEKVLTTLLAYGQVETPRQQEIMRKLWEPKVGPTDPMEALARRVAELVRREPDAR